MSQSTQKSHVYGQPVLASSEIVVAKNGRRPQAKVAARNSGSRSSTKGTSRKGPILAPLLSMVAGPDGGGGPPTGNVFRREGAYWTLVHQAMLVRLRDAKGLRYLAELLRQPGKKVHAIDLIATADTAGESGHHLEAAAARGRHRRRMQELAAEREEAERWRDSGRLRRIDAEMDVLARELLSAAAPATPSALTDAERARLAVTQRIKAALVRIGELHPALGRHLTTRVRTGMWCIYIGEAGAEGRWVV